VLEARAQLSVTRNQAHADWVGARANVTASESVVAEAEQQVALTRETQRQVEGSARLGVATNLELSDADDNFCQAQSAAAQARAQLQIRRAELAAAEGKLATFVLGGN
jgi:outer membrane protein